VPDDANFPDAQEVQRRLAALQARFTDGRTELVGSSDGSPIHLVAPNEEWATTFQTLRVALATALGPDARIEHIGSTSIPGIHAKPIIDLLVMVSDLADEPAYAKQIESIGVRLRSRELDLGHVYFRNDNPRDIQVHVCQTGSKWERDHLLFRDYLRAHPDAARAYEQVKLTALEHYAADRLAYTESKGPFIERTLAKAEEWAQASSWQP
jgi:GrpB-like predicted nucleotidyltransferase (UPF0157 family)